jgi:hypothetical protein
MQPNTDNPGVGGAPGHQLAKRPAKGRFRLRATQGQTATDGLVTAGAGINPFCLSRGRYNRRTSRRVPAATGHAWRPLRAGR